MYELTYGNSESKEFINYFSSEKEALHYIVDFLDKYYSNYPYIRVIDRKEGTKIDYGSHHWFYWIKRIDGPIWIEVFNRDEEEGTASVCGVEEGDDTFELFGITLVNVIRKKKNQMKEYIRLQQKQ